MLRRRGAISTSVLAGFRGRGSSSAAAWAVLGRCEASSSVVSDRRVYVY